MPTIKRRGTGCKELTCAYPFLLHRNRTVVGDLAAAKSTRTNGSEQIIDFYFFHHPY
jgi:hypothetical protein